MRELQPPPYPGDTRAKGWRFELDHERIRQSDTWALSPAEYRPWLLMLWMVAWEQTPCGSMPDDDALVCARIGMTPKVYAKAKPALMRGWWAADDGRLYHKVITERVLEMMEWRRKETERKRGYRASAPEAPGTPLSVPRDSHGTDDTGTITGTITSKDKEAPTELVGQADAQPYKVPHCPHEEIVRAYAELLPVLPQVAILSDVRRGHIAARWKAVCADQKLTREQGLDWFREFFALVSKSAFLTGNGKPNRETGRVWSADFDWLFLPTNFVKVVEGRYQERKAA